MTTDAPKKPTIFLIQTEGGPDRLVRALTGASVKQYLLGQVKVSKASGDDVATALSNGTQIESAISAPEVGAA